MFKSEDAKVIILIMLIAVILALTAALSYYYLLERPSSNYILVADPTTSALRAEITRENLAITGTRVAQLEEDQTLIATPQQIAADLKDREIELLRRELEIAKTDAANAQNNIEDIRWWLAYLVSVGALIIAGLRLWHQIQESKKKNQ